MLSLLLLTLVFGNPLFRGTETGVVQETVDAIELHHFFDKSLHHVFDQVIFYERIPGNGQYRVRAWCLVEDKESLNRRPVWCELARRYEVVWYDTDNRLLLNIRSSLFRERWMQFDPERVDKNKLDEGCRLSLRRPGTGLSSEGIGELKIRLEASLTK